MESTPDNRREHARRDAEFKVQFEFKYDVETKVEYQIVDQAKNELPKKYYALSKNISAAGLCIVAKHRLKKGDHLKLELYLPYAAEPVKMDGEVRWSEAASVQEVAKDTYQSGILIRTVDGQPVAETIYYDKEYHVCWSVLLESVLGSLRKLVKKGHHL